MWISASKYLTMYKTVQETFKKAMLLSEEKKNKLLLTKQLLLSNSNQGPILLFFKKEREYKYIVCFSHLLQSQKKNLLPEEFLIKLQGLFKLPDIEYE